MKQTGDIAQVFREKTEVASFDVQVSLENLCNFWSNVSEKKHMILIEKLRTKAAGIPRDMSRRECAFKIVELA